MPKIGGHSFFCFMLFFRFVSRHDYCARAAVTPWKFAVTADHAYARIARGSLWPSVTVYSFRSYFVPVVLKKSQSTRDKYASRSRWWRARCDLLQRVAIVTGTLNIYLRYSAVNKHVFIWNFSSFYSDLLILMILWFIFAFYINLYAGFSTIIPRYILF